MLKFIYFCMAVVVVSFLIVPMVTGVNETREDLAARTSLMASIENAQPSNDDLEGAAEQLNAIEPAAAGDDAATSVTTEDFSAEFKPKQHPAF